MADLSSYINITANTVITSNLSATGNVVSSSVISTTGNITGNYILGNGSQLTGLPATYGNSNVTTLLASLGSNTISSTGNITTTANISSGNVIVVGTANTGIGAVVAGATNTLLSNTVAGFTGNVNNYTQVTFQNKSTGTDATADFILTADNGSDVVNYGDFGIINSGYDNASPTNSLGNIVFAADTYLYAQGNTSNASQGGGNLAIGTTVPGKDVKIFAGGVTNSSIIANISNTGMSVTGNVTASNFIGNISITGNVTGTSANVSLVAGAYTYTFDNTGILTLPSSSALEGGEIDLTKAANSTLSGNTIIVDSYVDKLRFFESGGTNRGAYIDLTQAAAGVNTLLNNRVSAINLALDTSLTFDNLKIQIKAQSSGAWLFIGTVTGTASYQYSTQYMVPGGPGGTASTMAATTTVAAVGSTGYAINTAGCSLTTIVSDTTNSKMYRIIWIETTGTSPYGNFVSIERLV